MTMTPVFYVAADGPVFVWKQQRPGYGTTASNERFTSLPLAVDAAVVVARCYCGLFRCPDCGTEYSPTFVRHCPTCASVKRLTGDPLAAEWQANGAPSVVQWGEGCEKCGYTGEEWQYGICGGDGWTGKPCPHCIPGGENYMEIDEPEDDEPAPNCFECGQMIDGWAHPDGFGNYHCDKCCPTCDHIEDGDVRWCYCPTSSGSGPCPVCGGEMLPF